MLLYNNVERDGDGMAKKKIQRKVSKITTPKVDFGAKDKMKAFRCSKVIAELLDKEDNASETINKAILEYLSKKLIECPTCKGKGQIRPHKECK
jgi:hypothetical protein